MLTEEQFAGQARQLGHPVHWHGGVWWQRHAVGYCKPAFEFRSFSPRSSRPSFHRSLFGFSHQVPSAAEGTRTVEWMVLEGEDLHGFSMARLRSEKRNQVRKGLKSAQVRRITELEPHLEAMRHINIAQAERQMDTGSFGKPARYYQEQADAWREEIRRWFNLPEREWWGAFVDSRLAAYMLTFEVESVRFIGVMKTHTEALKLCLTDAIYFTVLEQAAASKTCQRVINGGPLRPSLDRYKEQFLFKRLAIPYYTAPVALFRLGMRLRRLKETIRLRWQAARRGSSESSQNAKDVASISRRDSGS